MEEIDLPTDVKNIINDYTRLYYQIDLKQSIEIVNNFSTPYNEGDFDVPRYDDEGQINKHYINVEFKGTDDHPMSIRREDILGVHKLYLVLFEKKDVQQHLYDCLDDVIPFVDDDYFDIVTIELFKDENPPRIEIFGYFYNFAECDYSIWSFYYDAKYKVWGTFGYEGKQHPSLDSCLAGGDPNEDVILLSFSKYLI